MKRQLSSVILYSIMVYLTLFMLNSAFPEVCQVGDVLAPGESCTYPGTDTEFSVLNDGRGQFGFFTSSSSLNIKNTTINGVVYTLVAKKLASGSWEIEEIADSGATSPPTNTAPTFTDGSTATRSVAENTAPGEHIGTAIAATDADNDTLTYTLGGTDAASFGIDATTGQLKTKAALDYETKRTYTVTVTVSDGSLTDTIAVTVNVTDVAETPANRAPVFTEGASTTRTVELPPKPENPGDMDIGTPLFATDADGDTLTYTLGGTDASLFHTYAFVTYLNYTTPGVQLTTRGGSLYDGTKSSYTVTLTVSDGSLTDTITVTINVTDVAETPTNRAPIFTSGSSTVRAIAENTAAGLHIGTPVVATDADNDTLTYTFGGTDAASFGIDATTGQLKTKAALDYETKSTYTVTVTVSDGNGGSDTVTVTITVTDVAETPTAAGVCRIGDVLAPGESCTYPGTDATFSVLNNGHARWNIPNLPSWLTWANQVSIGGSLSFTATINSTDYHFVAEEVPNDSWEIKEIGGDSPQQPEQPQQPQQPTPTLTASTTSPLTEATLDESVVTLTLSGANYARSTFDIRGAVTVSGIAGVTVRSFDIDRVNDTKVTVELTFDDTDFDSTSTLTFTVGADAIAGYSGSALTAQVSVAATTETPQQPQQPQQPEQPQQPQQPTPTLTASTTSPLAEATLHESVVTLRLNGGTYVDSSFSIARAIEVSGIDGVTFRSWDVDRVSDTEVTVELSFEGDFDTNATLTFSVGADAIASYDGSALTAQVSVTGGTESIVASTTAPLTEATLHESVVTLTLSGRTYVDSSYTVGRAITVSGIDGVTFRSWDVDRVSDTVVTVELTFDGDFDTNSTLTFTVGAGAIAGPALTAQIPVTGGPESIVASTDAPLTEATLHESVVTLTLSGRAYEDSSYTVGRAITVSGIDGVTFRSWDVDRISDTEVTVELTFNGNFQTDSRLIFTVEAGAIAGYGGPAFTAEIPVTAGLEADANNDGVVSVEDLVLVASNYGQTGANAADVNGDGVVNAKDLLVVAGALDSAGTAPSAQPQALEMFTAADVKLWLSRARQLDLTDPTALKGIIFLEQLLAALIPKETVLLPNYPNPFNPETWIPYRLAEDAFVTLTIYDGSGELVRTLDVGHRKAAVYVSRSKAIYWDGRNEFGEGVASGVYFYHLSAGDYSATRRMLILK